MPVSSNITSFVATRNKLLSRYALRESKRERKFVKKLECTDSLSGERKKKREETYRFQRQDADFDFRAAMSEMKRQWMIQLDSISRKCDDDDEDT